MVINYMYIAFSEYISSEDKYVAHSGFVRINSNSVPKPGTFMDLANKCLDKIRDQRFFINSKVDELDEIKLELIDYQYLGYDGDLDFYEVTIDE